MINVLIGPSLWVNAYFLHCQDMNSREDLASGKSTPPWCRFRDKVYTGAWILHIVRCSYLRGDAWVIFEELVKEAEDAGDGRVEVQDHCDGKSSLRWRTMIFNLTREQKSNFRSEVALAPVLV